MARQIDPLVLKLERDQARAVQRDMFPYMELLLENKVDHCRDSVDEYLNAIVARCLFLEVVKIFERKLLTKGNVFTFKLTVAQALPFYQVLMSLPINGKQVWLLNLRQLICDTLYNQFLEP